MNNNANYEVMATATKELSLSNVEKARLNEMLTLTNNNDIKTICTSVAKVLSMSNLMDYTLCKAYASIRLALKDEKTLSFKKWCELNEKEVSNTNKYATVWDKFYSDIADKDGISPRQLFNEKGINILEFTPSFLSSFVSKNTVDVVALFVASGVTSSVTCKIARELAKCIRTSKVGLPVIDTSIAIALVNGDITKYEDYGKKSEEKNSEEKKSEEKNSEEKKSEEKNSEEKNSEEKKPDEKPNINIHEYFKEYSTNDLMNLFKTIIGEKENKEIAGITIKFNDGKTKKF